MALPTRRARIVLAALALCAAAWPLSGAQGPAPPPDVTRLRLDLTSAAANQNIAQALEFYEALARATQSIETASLRAIAHAAVVDLSDPKTPDTPRDYRFEACAILLATEPARQPCRTVVQDVLAGSAGEIRALQTFTLMNAGIRQSAATLDGLRKTLDARTRIAAVRSAVRLPAAERVAWLAPALDAANAPGVRREAALLLAEIGTPAATAALTRVPLQATDLPTTIAFHVALARMGAPASLTFLQQRWSSLSGPLMLEAGLAMSLARSPYGGDPAWLMETSPPADRARLAWILSPRTPDVSRDVLRGLLMDSDPALRLSALRFAGLLRMGQERAVYVLMADRTPEVRLAAVHAVLQSTAPPAGAAAR